MATRNTSSSAKVRVQTQGRKPEGNAGPQKARPLPDAGQPKKEK